MRSIAAFASILSFLFLFSCKHDYSCETCPPLADTFPKDTLPSDYPFATGFCPKASSLGAEIPPHDSVRYIHNLTLPDSVILKMPIAGNQKEQGSCAAWATLYAAGSHYFANKNGTDYADSTLLSPSYSYNQIVKGECRNCTSIIEHLYILETQGACSLKDMPYNASDCITQPNSSQKEKAKKYQIKNWKTVDIKNPNLIKQQLLNKRTVIIAISVESVLKYIKHPYILSTVLGERGEAHAVVIDGYSEKRNAFRILNSWSTAWGDNGSCWISYAILKNILYIHEGYVITDD